MRPPVRKWLTAVAVLEILIVILLIIAIMIDGRFEEHSQAISIASLAVLLPTLLTLAVLRRK